jgi:hypothetical protein
MTKTVILILIVLFIFDCKGQTVVEICNNDLTPSNAAFYTTTAIEDWQAISSYYVQLNNILTTITSILSSLFTTSADQSSFTSLVQNQTSILNCTVPPFYILQTNQSSFQQLACCHIAQQRLTILSRLLNFANSRYLPIPPSPLSTGLLIENLSLLQQRAYYCSRFIVCAQEQSIMIPGCQVYLGLGDVMIYSATNSNYEIMLDQANTVVACVQAPTINTGCLTNSTFSLAYFLEFSSPELTYDASYAGVCGFQNLAYFSNQLSTAFCG